MKTQLIILLFIVSGVCYGQSVETDSTRLSREHKEQLLNNYKISSGNHPLDKHSSVNNTSDKIDYQINEDTEASDMNLSVPKFYIGPESDYSAKPITNPYANDYGFYARNAIMDGGWISTASSHTSYPALGSLTLIRANYEYMLSDHVIASVGVYGARYFYNLSSYEDFGVNASLNYKITDRLSFIGFGQYSARANINKIGGDNAWMIPSTNYGAVTRFMFNDNFGIQGGVKRELNPMNGKWRNIPIFAPVIKLR